MAEPREPVPVLLVVAAFSRDRQALAWTEQKVEDAFGPLGLSSFIYPFNQTSYYESEMGSDLQKCLLVCQDLIDPGRLADIKLLTNSLEQEFAQQQSTLPSRPLNLDPGILTLGKFCLATTKDQAHRIYLRSGIFAEVTLVFRAGKYEPWPWTYADYKQEHVRAFLGEARAYYRGRLEQVRAERADG